MDLAMNSTLIIIFIRSFNSMYWYRSNWCFLLLVEYTDFYFKKN